MPLAMSFANRLANDSRATRAVNGGLSSWTRNPNAINLSQPQHEHINVLIGRKSSVERHLYGLIVSFLLQFDVRVGADGAPVGWT